MTLGPFRRNTTGTPDPDYYLLGRAQLFYAEVNTDDTPDLDGDGYHHLGNCPEFAATAETNFLDHFSSMSGTKQLDRRILIDEAFNIEFALEEFTEEVAKLWLRSTPAAATNAGIAGFVERQLITNVVRGLWYPIVDGSGNPAVGIRQADLTVEKAGTPDVALTVGTDYEVDLKAGFIRILTTSALAADGDEIDVTLVANANCEAVRYIPIQNRDGQVNVAMRLHGEDPDSGLKYIMHLNKVSLSPNGALGLINESELARFPFSGAAERCPGLTYPVGWIMSVPSSPTS